MMLLFYYHNFLFQSPIRNFILILIFLAVLLPLSYLLVHIRTDDLKINWIVVSSMILLFMIIALTWIRNVPNTQISDFGNFWSRVPGFFLGDKLYQTDNDYFSKYAYQTGFMVYILGVVKIFGYNIFAIQFLNVIFQGLILLITYLLVIKIFDNIKMARLAVLLLAIDIDWFALNSQASNQYLGSLLYLLTFYLLLQDKWYGYILGGISLAAGCLIRPIGPVVIAGIIVYTLIYMLWKHHDYKTSLKVLLSLAIYLILFSLAGVGIKASGINAYGLSNHDPEWKFLTGLDYQSAGTYSEDLNKLIDPNQSRDQMQKVEQKKLTSEINYLNTNHAWLSLFIHKTQILWSSRTLATDFTSFNLDHSQRTVQVIDFVAYLGSIVMIIFSWIGSLELFKSKFSDKIYLLILPLMAFAFAQLIIEVQGRYRIEFLPVIAVIASLGLYKTVLALGTLKNKLHQKNTLSFE